MGDIRRIGDLELSEDMDFQRKDWAVQRVGWLLMALVSIAALAGLLGGSGPAASATAGDEASGASIDYERFAHIQRPTSITIRARPGPGESRIPLFLNNDYLRGVSITAITPQPESVRAVEGGLEFAFSAEPGAQVEAIFELQAQQPGALSGRAGRADAPVAFTQFVYP